MPELWGADYSSSGSNRSQSASAGGSGTTTLSVTEYARLVTGAGQAGTMTSTDPSTGSGTYTLRRNGSTIGSATFSASQSSWGMTVTSTVLLVPGDTLSIQAPAGSPFPAGTTVSASWSFRTLVWRRAQEQSNRVGGNLGGSWSGAQEFWGAEPTGFDSWQWTRVWRVAPPPPAGVSVSLQQELISGGAVLASWTNAPGTTDMSYDVQWEINGFVWTTTSGAVTGSSLPQATSLGEENFSDGAQVRARMRYRSGGVSGDWGPWSSAITYFE